MAHGRDPYLQNLSSLPSDHGTPESEVSHSHQTDDFIGHDGFSSATVSDEASATNTNYYFNRKTNSNWSSEIGDCQRNSREMAWQSGGEQKEYLPRRENSVSNFETNMLATTEQCSFAPQLEEHKQDCGVSTVSPFFENYVNVKGSSDKEVGEPRSCKFMTSTSVPKPKTGATPTNQSEWLQNHTENAKLSDCSYPKNLLPGLAEENIIQCLKDRSNPIVLDGISSASSILHTDSEMQEGSQMCKQETFLNTSPNEDVCQSVNLSDARLKENHSGNAKDATEMYKARNPDKTHICSDSQGTNTQRDNPKKGCQANMSHSSALREKSVSDSCQDEKDGLSKTSLLNVANDELMNCNVSMSDASETCDHSKSNLQIHAAVSLDHEKVIETVDCSSYSEPVSESPTAISDASHSESCIHPDVDPHFLPLTETVNKEQDGSCSVFHVSDDKDLSDLSTKSLPEKTSACENVGCSNIAANDGGHSAHTIDSKNKQSDVFDSAINVSYNKDQRDLTIKTLEMEQACPAEKLSLCESKCERNYAANDCCSVAQTSDSNKRSGAFDSESSSIVDRINMKLETPITACTNPAVTCDGQSVNKSIINNGDNTIPHSDNVDKKQHREKDVLRQCEKDPFSDQQSILLLQSSEETSYPGQTIKPNTPENTSMLMDLLHQGQTESPVDTTPSLKQDQNAEKYTSSGQSSEKNERSLSFASQKPEHFVKNYENKIVFDEQQSVHDDDPLRQNSSSDLNEMPVLDPCKFVEPFIEKSPQLKPSTEMLKRLQPIVLLKTSDVVDLISDMYICAQCMHITSNLDHLIEHHTLHHSMHSFQLCKSCGVYLVRHDQSGKHLCGESSPVSLSKPGKQKKRKGKYCNKCGLSFSKMNPFISHMRTHTGKTPYKCEKCGIYFAQSCTLRRHKSIPGRCGKSPPERKLASRSDNGTIKSMFNCLVKLYDITKTPFCKFCGKCFKSKLKVQKHVYNVHKRPATIMKQCKAPTEMMMELASDKKKYKCPLCPRIFKYYFNRNRHLKDCVKEVAFGKKNQVRGRYQCPLCLATFSLSSNRYRHINTFCLRNFLKFLGQETPKLIKTTHSNEMKTVLNKLKAEEKQLNGQATDNVTYAEREPQYKCNLCPAVFFHPSGKYRHMKKHKLFELTGRRFKYKNSLKKLSLTKSTVTSDTNEKQKQGSVSVKCKYCEKSFGSSHSLKMHEYTHQGERPYYCLQCGKGFKTRAILSHHKVTHQRRIQCTVCRKILPTIGELIQHRKSHLNRGLLQCPDCPQQFNYPAYLLRHLRSHLKSQNKLLQLEEKQEILDSSPQTLNETQQHQCPLCNEVFDDSKLLRKHSFTHIAKSSSPQCPFCKCKFTKRRNLLRHMARHAGGKLFSCNCGKRFSNESNFKLHRETCSAIKETKGPFVCRHCSRTFIHKIHLLKHYRGHNNKTLSRCTTCNLYFGTSKIPKHQRMCNMKTITDSGLTSQTTKQLTAHNVPSKETKYQCQYCSQTFQYGSLYLRHLSKHSDVQNHACILCGQNFPSQALCFQHEASCDGFHKIESIMNKKADLPKEDTSEFKCKFCNKMFTKSQYLRRHILTHNEVKPYRCKACDGCFSRYDHLKVHLGCCKGKVKLQLRPEICIPKISLDHVGTGWQREFGLGNVEKEQTLECKECGRSFATQSKLTWHISMFHTVKRFKCMRCSSFFSHEKTLRSHLKLRKCRLATTVKRNALLQQSISQTQPKKNISSEKHNRILARIQPTSSKQNFSKTYKCSFCPRTFRTSAHLKVHMRLHSGEKPFVCDCGKTFFRKDHLQRHITICVIKKHQSPPNDFSCAYCNSRFLLFSQLQEHFLNAHKLETMDEPVKTAPLQQHLSNIQNFEENLLDVSEPSQPSKLSRPLEGKDWQTATRLKESPFACKICNRGYWNKTLLRNHFRKCRRSVPNNNNTQVDVPLRADIDLALTDSSAEDSPEEYIEDTEPQNKSSQEKKPVVYQCSECDKSFTDGLLLISHLEDHGREEQEKRLNKCSKCGRVFANQARLIKHMKIHESGQFVCTDCSTELSSKSELELHRKKCHDPSNPYSCRLCKYRFKTKGSLCDHCTKEHPNDIFSCRFCNRNYTLRASLIRHNKKCYGQEQKEGAEKSSSDQSTSDSESNDNDDNDSVDTDSDSAPYFPCHVCGKTFTTSESLEDHQRCHLGEKPYECAECGQCFFQAAQLQQHERKHKSEFQCRVCGRGFVSLFALRKHKHTSGKKRPFRCAKCQLYFTNPAQLAEHLLIHREENFPCDICNRVFPSKSSRAEHRKIHLHNSTGRHQTAFITKNKPASLSMAPTNEFKYRCGVCCERFRNPEELSEHGCMAGIERQYSCLDCDKHFLHSSHLQKHMSTHKHSWSQSEYPCNQCNNSFSFSHEFLNHLRNHDETVTHSRVPGGEGFVCPVCHQCFASATELGYHFPMHPSGTFECKMCNMSFLTASKRKEHEVCHIKESKWTKCGQSFLGSKHDCSQKHLELMNTKYSNALHKDNSLFGDEDEIDVTGEDLCCCPFCPMQFSSKSHLLEHQNIQHPKEKLFTCEICGKTFAERKYLNKHLKKHSQKEPAQSTSQIKFQCAQCRCEFDTAKDLSLHLKLHVAEKEVGEYRCDMCYKSFSQLRLLRVHQESHVGQVVYECTECDKAFAFPHLLEEHQQSHA